MSMALQGALIFKMLGPLAGLLPRQLPTPQKMLKIHYLLGI
jgi:hypothetical protein